jgi:hypothetical protein
METVNLLLDVLGCFPGDIVIPFSHCNSGNVSEDEQFSCIFHWSEATLPIKMFSMQPVNIQD